MKKKVIYDGFLEKKNKMTAKRKNRISITFQLNAKIGKEKK